MHHSAATISSQYFSKQLCATTPRNYHHRIIFSKVLSVTSRSLFRDLGKFLIAPPLLLSAAKDFLIPKQRLVKLLSADIKFSCDDLVWVDLLASRRFTISLAFRAINYDDNCHIHLSG